MVCFDHVCGVRLHIRMGPTDECPLGLLQALENTISIALVYRYSDCPGKRVGRQKFNQQSWCAVCRTVVNQYHFHVFPFYGLLKFFQYKRNIFFFIITRNNN